MDKSKCQENPRPQRVAYTVTLRNTDPVMQHSVTALSAFFIATWQALLQFITQFAWGNVVFSSSCVRCSQGFGKAGSSQQLASCFMNQTDSRCEISLVLLSSLWKLTELRGRNQPYQHYCYIWDGSWSLCAWCECVTDCSCNNCRLMDAKACKWILNLDKWQQKCVNFLAFQSTFV